MRVISGLGVEKNGGDSLCIVQEDLSVLGDSYLVVTNKMEELAQCLGGCGGMEVHQDQAFLFFDLSARSGFAPAELYMKGQGIQRERLKAVHLLEEAVQRGDTEAKRLIFRARFSRTLLGN